MNKLLYSDITEKIIGAGFEVHNYLGCGFLEKVYQRALIIELNVHNWRILNEFETDIYYKDAPAPIGLCRADIIVNDCVLVEVKSTRIIEPTHIAQTLNYMKVFNIEVGLLLCFGGKSLFYKRLVLNK